MFCVSRRDGWRTPWPTLRMRLCDISNANNQLLLLHQALVMAYICCCAIFVGVEGLSHRRGNVLWGFVTSPERLLFIISQQYNIPTMCGSRDRYHFRSHRYYPPEVPHPPRVRQQRFVTGSVITLFFCHTPLYETLYTLLWVRGTAITPPPPWWPLRGLHYITRVT